MKAEEQLRTSPDVIAREVGGETVLMDLASGTYFGLNAVGGLVWQWLEEEPLTLTRLCERVEDAFDAPRAQIESDLRELAEQLRAHGLIEPLR